MNRASGFIIRDCIEYHRVTVFDLEKAVPLESQLKCPGCLSALHPVAALVGNKGVQQVRIGGCDACGYIGYMDRPSKEWMVNFYAKTWDTHIAKSIEEVRAQPHLQDERRSSRRETAALAAKLPISKDRTVCEIGSGYGNALRYMKDLGFKNVVGTENSAHRAKIVSEAFNIQVFSGNFEGETVQTNLRQVAPMGLFFSHHVFEHVYHPQEVVEKMSSLQEVGDYIIFALPNVAGEHAGYSTFYLPHLHSFSRQSLERLFNRYNYEIIEDHSPDDSNMVVVAKKVAGVPQRKFAHKEHYMSDIEGKLIRGLGLDQVQNSDLQKYEWLVPHQPYDDASLTPIKLMGWYLYKFSLFIKSKLRRHISKHIFLISPLKEKYTQSSIEIQFPENIFFLMK